MGLVQTAGDGVLDICEDIYNCPKDAAPISADSIISVENNTYTCTTDYSISQWIVDDEPLYDLHFTFDDLLATDDSDNRMNPDQNIGYDCMYPAPQPAEIDDRGAFNFNGVEKLFSECDNSLDYSNSDISSFAVIKRRDTDPDKQVIFSLNDDDDLYFGIEDNKFKAFLRDDDLDYGVEAISNNGYWGNCISMQHNDATWQGASQKIGTLIAGRSYTLSAMFRTTNEHMAYINIHTSDWRDASGDRTSKSFVSSQLPGNGSWSVVSVNITIPLTMDNGIPPSNCIWSVNLYGYIPITDNSHIFYDNISLLDGSSNLVINPGFESGFDHWTHSSYIGERVLSGTTEIDNTGWYTLGIVYDRPLFSLYINGVKEAEMNINISDFPKFGNYTIGAYDRNDVTLYVQWLHG